MSDETADRTKYGSATKKKSGSGTSSKALSNGTGAVASGGAATGTRKADSPSAWLRSPARTDASARARSYKAGR